MSDMIDACVREYFATARERFLIWIRRVHGVDRPWTTDAAMARYRFCNVFREQDRTTVWIQRNVRGPLYGEERVVTAMVACRFINRIETLEALLRGGLFDSWNALRAIKVLSGMRPIVGAAYMIKTPTGMDKLHGVISVIDNIASRQNEIVDHIRANPTLESAWQKMQEFNFVGSFIAYEIVSDLRHTLLLHDATDVNTWAAPGPGASKGLSWLQNRTISSVPYSKSAAARALDMMKALLELSRDTTYWPPDWPQWEMREVEHWLCEYFKWVRVAYLGERMKRNFLEAQK